MKDKIEKLESLCAGCKFTVVGKGDQAVIRISEFGRGFTVTKETANMEGEWPECWFDYEIALRPKPEDRTMEAVMKAAEHHYSCRCGLCREYWRQVGIDPDTGKYGPFTEDEIELS